VFLVVYDFAMDLFPPLIGKCAVDNSRMVSTLQISGGRGTGIHEITGLLKKYGCGPDDVLSICRQEQGKPGTYEVGFAGLTALNCFLEEGGDAMSYRTRTFSCINLGSQHVTVRLHWLPSYIKDEVVGQMCRRFGEVVSVEREKTQCDIFNVETGVRVVKMILSVDDIKCLPHVLSFKCGTKALVSVPGRPPLCLRCMTVGHMRRDCGADTGARRLFTAPVPPTLSEGKAWQRDSAPQPRAVEEPGSEGEASPTASVPVPSPEVPSPVQGAASTAESVVSSVQEDDSPVSADAEMAVPASPIPAVRLNRGEKRQADREDEVRDSAYKIPPNRYMSGVAGDTETSNMFDVLGLLSDEDSSPGVLQIDMDC